MMADGFAEDIEKISGVRLSRCYQCMTCTLGCPVAGHMDLPPHRLIRAVQTGSRKEVLGAASLQLCVSCETCSSRCPNGIHVDRIIDTLRVEALREGAAPAIGEVRAFHRAFLSGIRSRGRVFELGMVIRLKLATWRFFQDAKAGMKMFLKGKLGLIPHGIKGRNEVRRIFEETVGKRGGKAGS